MAENKLNEDKNQELTKFLTMILASIVIMFILFAGVNYVIMENLITQKFNSLPSSTEEISEESEEDEIQKGIIVDLGDFTVNLCDENQKKYLRVNVAIEVSKKDNEFVVNTTPEKSKGHGHGKTEEKADPMEEIQKEMNQFKPAIRDSVITNLSSKTSSELATTAGKELAKEQITNDINSILAGEREVIRVSFGQFIMQ